MTTRLPLVACALFLNILLLGTGAAQQRADQENSDFANGGSNSSPYYDHDSSFGAITICKINNMYIINDLSFCCDNTYTITDRVVIARNVFIATDNSLIIEKGGILQVKAIYIYNLLELRSGGRIEGKEGEGPVKIFIGKNGKFVLGESTLVVSAVIDEDGSQPYEDHISISNVTFSNGGKILGTILVDSTQTTAPIIDLRAPKTESSLDQLSNIE